MLDSQTYRVAAEVEFAGDSLAARQEERLREAYLEIRDYEDMQLAVAVSL